MKFDKRVYREKLLKLLLPMTFEYFLFALVPVADSLMLVKLEQDAMSAVSLATQVNFVFSLFTYTISMAASMLVSQYWGKKDIKSVEEVWGFSQLALLPFGIIFFILTFFYPKFIMNIYTSESNLIFYGAKYLRVVSFSYLILSVLRVIEAILKNLGYVKQVTFSSCVMVVVNIILNAVFIYGLFGFKRMDVDGAALATVISSIISLILLLYVGSQNKEVKFRFNYMFNIDSGLRKDYIHYSLPVLGNQITWGFGFTTLTIIMGHLGSDAVAANSIVSIIKDLISCFCFALSGGSLIMIGNELGANNLDIAKEYGKRLCKLGIISGIIAGVIIAASTPIVIDFVDLTDTASYYLKWMMIMCVYYMVGRTMNSLVIGGIFCAGGDTRFGFICDTVTMWVFIIPLGLLFAFVIKAPVLVVFFILNLDEIIKLPVVYKHYKKYKWVNNLTV